MAKPMERPQPPLEPNEDLYRMLAELASDIIFVIDKDERVEYVNRAAAEQLGRRPEDIIGGNANELFPPELAKRLSRNRRRVVETGESLSFEDLMTLPDRQFWLDTQLVPVKTEAGEVRAVMGISRDITDRKQAEEALRTAKELGDALNAINAAINSTLDFNEIMQRVVAESGRAIGAETSGIMLREGDGWVAKYLHGSRQWYVGQRFIDEQAKASVLAAGTGKPVVINDTLNDDRVNRQMMEKYEIRSMLLVPLAVKDEVIGSLFFQYHSASIAFTEAQIDFAGKLAASLALAIENSRLYAVQRNIADTLQEALLTVPQRIPGVDFGYLYRSATGATQVGGDFYDLFELEHERVGVVIGDVSGKGLAAASMTALVKNTIKAYAHQGDYPAQVMAKTNEVVGKATAPSMFVTVFFGILATTSGALTYCSAGHPPAIIRRNTWAASLLTTGSAAIGALAGLNYVDGEEALEPGDTLIVYTDGITEARRDSEFFGEERLIKCVRDLRPVSARELPQAIFGEVMGFTGGRLADDVALVAISLSD